MNEAIEKSPGITLLALITICLTVSLIGTKEELDATSSVANQTQKRIEQLEERMLTLEARVKANRVRSETGEEFILNLCLSK